MKSTKKTFSRLRTYRMNFRIKSTQEWRTTKRFNMNMRSKTKEFLSTGKRCGKINKLGRASIVFVMNFRKLFKRKKNIRGKTGVNSC